VSSHTASIAVLPAIDLSRLVSKPSLPLPLQAVTGSTWSRLLPSLHAAGVPILDPRFVALVARLCVPHVDLDGGCCHLSITSFCPLLQWNATPCRVCLTEQVRWRVLASCVLQASDVCDQLASRCCMSSCCQTVT
jgi:hypothetical protein